MRLLLHVVLLLALAAVLCPPQEARAQNLAVRLRHAMDTASPAQRRKAAKEAVTGMAMMVATHPWVYPFTVHQAVVWGNKLGEDPIHDRK